MNYEKLCREQIAELSPRQWPKTAVLMALTYAVLAVAQAIRDASKPARR